MADLTPSERLRALEERIEAAKAAGQDDTPHQEEHYSMAQMGWRMVLELVVGLAIGAGMGLGLDALFGTRPIFLVLMTLLGFAAGVKTMMHTANEFQTKNTEERSSKDGEGT